MTMFEFVIGVRAAGFVPGAFVDADHAPGVAGDAAVGEEVGRVGEDEVDGVFGDGGEDGEAVALKDFDVVFGVVEGGLSQARLSGTIGSRRFGIGGHVDQSGSLIREARVSREGREKQRGEADSSPACGGFGMTSSVDGANWKDGAPDALGYDARPGSAAKLATTATDERKPQN
jgi:hypothetical protein